MNHILHFISQKFSLIMIAAVIIGITFEELSGLINPYIKTPLMVAIFLSFLKIDFQVLKTEIKRPLLQMNILIFTNLILPVLAFLLMSVITKIFRLDHEWALAAMVLYAAPTAALGPTLCILFKGNLERGSISLVASTLCVPITFPLLLGVFVDQQTQIDFLNISIDLLKLVLIPFILAIFTRKLFTGATKFINPYVAPISVIMIAVMVIGCVHGVKPMILSDFMLLLKALLLSYFMIFAVFSIGWYSSLKGSTADRLTLSILSAWPNIGLIIVIVTTYLKTDYQIIFLFVIASEIPWNTCFYFAQKFANKVNANLNKGTP